MRSETGSVTANGGRKEKGPCLSERNAQTLVSRRSSADATDRMLFHELPGGVISHGGIGQRDVPELRKLCQCFQAAIGDSGSEEVEFFQV